MKKVITLVAALLFSVSFMFAQEAQIQNNNAEQNAAVFIPSPNQSPLILDQAAPLKDRYVVSLEDYVDDPADFCEFASGGSVKLSYSGNLKSEATIEFLPSGRAQYNTAEKRNDLIYRLYVDYYKKLQQEKN